MKQTAGGEMLHAFVENTKEHMEEAKQSNPDINCLNNDGECEMSDPPCQITVKLLANEVRYNAL